MSSVIYSLLSKLPISISKRFYNTFPSLKQNKLLITNSPTGNWTDMVANGTYIAACSCYSDADNTDNSMISISSNSGSSWTTVDNKQFPEEMNWRAIDMSNDGKYITVVSDSDMILFNNQMRTLTIRPPVSNKKGAIYYSNDYGSTWNKASIDDLPKDYSYLSFKSVCMDTTGKDQYVATNDSIFLSTNYGVDWKCIYSFNKLSGIIHKISMVKIKTPNITSNYMLGLIIKGNGDIFKFLTSNNGGLSWNQTLNRIGTQNRDWSSLCYTDDGKELFVSTTDTGLYKNTYYGLSTFTGANAILSTPTTLLNPPRPTNLREYKLNDVVKRSSTINSFIVSSDTTVFYNNSNVYNLVSTTDTNVKWTCVAMSGDHVNIHAATLGGKIYTIL